MKLIRGREKDLFTNLKNFKSLKSDYQLSLNLNSDLTKQLELSETEIKSLKGSVSQLKIKQQILQKSNSELTQKETKSQELAQKIQPYDAY